METRGEEVVMGTDLDQQGEPAKLQGTDTPDACPSRQDGQGDAPNTLHLLGRPPGQSQGLHGLASPSLPCLRQGLSQPHYPTSFWEQNQPPPPLPPL